MKILRSFPSRQDLLLPTFFSDFTWIVISNSHFRIIISLTSFMLSLQLLPLIDSSIKPTWLSMNTPLLAHFQMLTNLQWAFHPFPFPLFLQITHFQFSTLVLYIIIIKKMSSLTTMTNLSRALMYFPGFPFLPCSPNCLLFQDRTIQD